MTQTRLLLAIVAAGTLGGCDGCDEDHPYTPFGVTSALPTAPTPPPVADAATAPPAFTPRKSQVAPAGRGRWRLGELELVAPEGRTFARGLSADFDADGESEAVAWLVPAGADGKAAGGELWLFPKAGQPRRVFSRPPFIPSGPDCKHDVGLAQTGPQTVTVDVSASCKAKLLARVPVRAVAVIAPLRQSPVVLSVRAAEPAPGESLNLGVDSTDRDEDGRDDVDLTVTVRAIDSQRPARGHLVWLDRAAGPSRDPKQPATSLAAIGSLEVVRSTGKNTSRSVPDGIHNAWRLYASLCAESGVPRVFDGEGAPYPCGSLGLAVDRLTQAELSAALKQDDLLEAFAVLDRDGWYHAAISDEKRAALEAKLRSATKPVMVKEVATLGSTPPKRGTAPRFSPLAFESTGALLVQTAAGVVRVTGDGTDEELVGAEAGIEGWPLEVTIGSGVRWTGVLPACDRSELLLTFGGPGAASADPVPTRVLAARPGLCGGSKLPKVPAPVPLGTGDTGLSAIAAGSLVGPRQSWAEAAMRPDQPGAPRSPDGRWLVVPSALGVVALSKGDAELWHGDALKDPEALTDCVISDGARRIACISDGRVLLFKHPTR